MEFNLPCFDVKAVAESGQCFRWQETAPGAYRIVAFGRLLHIRQDPTTGTILADCTKKEYKGLWASYFDAETDYEAIIHSIPPRDAYLRKAARVGEGIRILRQDSWETLISFIISQRKNIPAIRQAVEKLCAAAGRVIAEEDGNPVFSFPDAAELSRLSMEDLKACGLGYRAKYIYEAARRFGPEGWPSEAYGKLGDKELATALCDIFGVGRKIADCTMLFGFHRLGAFPMDVWMHRVEELHYPKGIPVKKYGPWAGVMQQYMFAYERLQGGR